MMSDTRLEQYLDNRSESSDLASVISDAGYSALFDSSAHLSIIAAVNQSMMDLLPTLHLFDSNSAPEQNANGSSPGAASASAEYFPSAEAPPAPGQSDSGKSEPKIFMVEGCRTQVERIDLPEGTLKKDDTGSWRLFRNGTAVEGDALEAFALKNSLGLPLSVEDGIVQGDWSVKDDGALRYNCRGTEENFVATRSADGDSTAVTDFDDYSRVETDESGNIKQTFWDGYSYREGHKARLDDGRFLVAYTDEAADGLPSPKTTIRDAEKNTLVVIHNEKIVDSITPNERKHVRSTGGIAGVQTTQYHDTIQWRKGHVVESSAVEHAAAGSHLQQIEFTDGGNVRGMTVDTQNGRVMDLHSEGSGTEDSEQQQGAGEELEATGDSAVVGETAIENLKPRYETSEIAEAVERARSLGLPLVTHIGATWCPPCIDMETKTWKEVEPSLSGQAVFLHLDVDQAETLSGSNLTIANAIKASVEGFPTIRVFRPTSDGSLNQVEDSEFTGFRNTQQTREHLLRAFSH